MATLKLVIKHAGSSLVSNLIEVDALDDADEKINELLAFWRELPIDRDITWYEIEDDLLQRDILTIPGEDEHHFLFRFTFKE